MPAPLVGVAATAAARLIAKKLATKTVKKAVTSSARVRKNTNAVASTIKADSPTAWRTGPIQRNSVKKVVGGKTKQNYPTKNELGIGDKKVVAKRATAPKTTPKPVAKKTVAVRATGIRSKKLSAAQERAIEAERRFGSSRFDWR
jgi:hypothetical protein